MVIQFDEEKQKKRIAQLRHKEEEEAVKRNAQKIRGRYVDLSGMSIETDALGKISEKLSRSLELAAFKIVGDNLYIAVRNPNREDVKKQFDVLREKGFTILDYLASRQSLEKAWDRYADIAHTSGTRSSFLDISEESLETIAKRIKTNTDIENLVRETLAEEGQHRITRLIEVIFGSGIATLSSDVHIEPQENQVRLRLRQDGVLYDIAYIDHETEKKLNSRIKILAHLKLTQEIKAQDGRFTIDYKKNQIEVRVSVVPGSYGESIVMRILNPNAISVSLDKLGIEPRLYGIIQKEIAKPNGLILTTGPTGSGKTTTLYAFLKKIYNPEIKIITIEDPVEYHLEGITQTQVNHEKGYTFLNGLRAALRQDPDVVMVGEIRDAETAKIAINASLTGHLVLSTLHTNNAAGAIPRLIDLGVSPKTLPSALTASLAQRLVRKLCAHCREKKQPSPVQLELIRKVLHHADSQGKDLAAYGIQLDQDITLYTSPGCPQCNGVGYRGRIGLFEAILTDEHIEAVIYDKPGEREIRRAADKQGILSMQEDGVLKAIAGVTSLEEVMKVVDLEHDLEITDQSLNTTIEEIAKLSSVPTVVASSLPNETASGQEPKESQEKPAQVPKEKSTQKIKPRSSSPTKVVAPPPNLPTQKSQEHSNLEKKEEKLPQKRKFVEATVPLPGTPEQARHSETKQDQQSGPSKTSLVGTPPHTKESLTSTGDDNQNESLRLLKSLSKRLDSLEKNLHSIDSGLDEKLSTMREQVNRVAQKTKNDDTTRENTDQHDRSAKQSPPTEKKETSSDLDKLIAREKHHVVAIKKHESLPQSPYGLDNDIRDIEIHLLVDYLKNLEQEQQQHPEVGIAKQIREIRKTVVEILKTMPRKDEMVIVGRDGKIVKSEIDQLIDQLLELEEEQTRNPHIGTVQKLRALRQAFEHL